MSLGSILYCDRVLAFLASPCSFCLSQKQLTQDSDADEVEVAIDNTAFMDEFFSEVGDLLLPPSECASGDTAHPQQRTRTLRSLKGSQESPSFTGAGWPDQEVTGRVSPILPWENLSFSMLGRKSAEGK